MLCNACARPICTHPDPVYAGVIPVSTARPHPPVDGRRFIPLWPATDSYPSATLHHPTTAAGARGSQRASVNAEPDGNAYITAMVANADFFPVDHGRIDSINKILKG